MLGKAGYLTPQCVGVSAGLHMLRIFKTKVYVWFKQVQKYLVQAGHSTPKCLSAQAGVHGSIVYASVWKGFSSISFSTGKKGVGGSESQSDQ